MYILINKFQDYLQNSAPVLNSILLSGKSAIVQIFNTKNLASIFTFMVTKRALFLESQTSLQLGPLVFTERLMFSKQLVRHPWFKVMVWEHACSGHVASISLFISTCNNIRTILAPPVIPRYKRDLTTFCFYNKIVLNYHYNYL